MSNFDASSLVTLAVAVIAALSAMASQRAASKAMKQSTQISSRTDLEKEAYKRAREYDTETIQRQQEEINKLRSEVLTARELEKQLRDEVGHLKERVAILEAHDGQRTKGEPNG